ncbi:MAG: hypothetical protein Q9187_001203 [Circinaria calcarea]
MSRKCSKYTITNGCGHLYTVTYRYCNGKHKDSWNENAYCFDSSQDDEDNEKMSVCMGTSFCNRGCKAMCMGWSCCTCGYEIVEGFWHEGIGMLVHTSSTGKLHAFCGMCTIIDVPGIPTANRSMTSDTINHTVPITNSSDDSDSDNFEDALTDTDDYGDMGERILNATKMIELMNLAEHVHKYADTPMDVIPTGPMQKTRYMTEVPNVGLTSTASRGSTRTPAST